MSPIAPNTSSSVAVPDAAATPTRAPVSARGLPLIGVLPAVVKSPLASLTRIAHEHSGAVVTLPFGPVKVYMPTRPHQVAHVLHDRWKSYPKGRGGMWKQIRRLFGDSLVTLDGESWVKDRRLLQPIFSRQNLDALAGEMIESITASLDALEPRARQGAPLAINKEMATLTEDVVLRALFGVTLDRAEAEELRASLMQAFEVTMKQLFLFFLPRQIPLPGELAFRRGLRRLDAALLGLLRRRRTSPGTSKDLLSLLLDTRDQATSAPLADEHVRDEIVTMFFAGHESTALAQSWTLYLLARNPRIQEQLEAEVDAVLGRRKPTASDLPKLVYTRQVLDESLRLYPPGWLMPRVAAEADVIDGYPIPAGAFVAINLYALHRDPATWDRPASFEPERFASGASRPRGQYIPFGAGPRLCIGDQFGLMKAQLALAMTVQRFRMRLAVDEPIEARGLGGSLQPATNMMMHVTPRD